MDAYVIKEAVKVSGTFHPADTESALAYCDVT